MSDCDPARPGIDACQADRVGHIDVPAALLHRRHVSRPVVIAHTG
jgi:hypothetical protein